ncbi:hypothetical protein L1987_18596 [Smallanthus sonchifolius]|uniref:Uncharacterized protein n=1 Tax=Smallanthus sonchifolius TaxID=185202 RepID=A0ACB9J177_9ASTR|nr:hypothetical protein L1987_18596 [Smallanthus sonchifolius]
MCICRKDWGRSSKSKRKGKEPTSGSVNPPPKRNRRNLIIDKSESDQEMEVETEQILKPHQKRSTPLSSLHPMWQEDLYIEKIGDLKDNESIFMCERAVMLYDFRPSGVVECFTRLGWEAALSFHDIEGRDRIPSKAILKWMATLEKDVGSNPPFTATLTDMVGGQRVVMSFDTIRQVAPFDSFPAQEYVYPPDRQILDNATIGDEGFAMLRDFF